MQYTQNYKFKKPDGADQVNIQDFNDNADKMDTELKKQIVADGGDTSNTIAKFEDYTGSVTLPDAETALGNIKTDGKISALLGNIKAVLTGAFLKKYILKTMEEVMANTVAGRTADALLVKELNSNLSELENKVDDSNAKWTLVASTKGETTVDLTGYSYVKVYLTNGDGNDMLSESIDFLWDNIKNHSLAPRITVSGKEIEAYFKLNSKISGYLKSNNSSFSAELYAK